MPQSMLDFVPYEVHCEAPLRTGWANVIYKCNKDTDNYSMLIKDLQTTDMIVVVTLSLYTQLTQ
jgi:hypothetical protein